MSGILDVFDRVTVLESFAQKLEKTEVLDFVVDIKNKSVKTVISSKELIEKADLFDYIEQVKHVYDLEDVDIKIKYSNIDFSEKYYRNLLVSLFRRSSICKAFLTGSYGEMKDDRLEIRNVKCGRELLEKNRCAEILSEIISFELGRAIQVFIDADELDMETYATEKEERTLSVARHLAEEVAKREPREEIAPEPEEEPEEDDEDYSTKMGLIFGRAIKEKIMPMIDLVPGEGIFAVKGEVIDVESREIKKDGVVAFVAINFDIGDDNWAISCEIFGKVQKVKKIVPAIKVGNILSVRGNYRYDERSHSDKMKVLSFARHEKPEERMDNAGEKRVELHLHTKMSAKDAVSSATDLINRAAQWGHPAIAITDHGVAQAFPEAFGAAKKLGKAGKPIKVLYGTEGYLVNDLPLESAEEESFAEKTYIVFDIETTGLDAETETFTEIGAVKILGGEIVDRFSQLINPERPIPQKIVELTGINDRMVEGMPKIDEVLPKFLEFCGDNTVVAHNARFDVGFVRAFAKKQGLTFCNKVIDTVALSREMYPDERVHKLNIVAKRLGVTLENHHRAVDDAEACSGIFVKLMNMKEEKQRALGNNHSIETNPELLKKETNHIVILAKNSEGLKNLYKLISMSNMDYYYRRPRIPKSVLKKYREGLVIGSACEQGELYVAVREKRTEKEIREIAEFYDYLEIQPLGNNAFMVRSGEVQGEEELIEINKKIVALGDELKKPVVATCDVHFMEPQEAMFRKVLLGVQGFEDADNQAPLFFRTTEEMLEEFSYLGEEKAYEVVVTNTRLVADMIEDIKPLKEDSYPPSIENCEQDLEDMCRKRAYEIYGENLPEIVQKRMDRELGCILGYGYAVMYMIAHKLVKKSNEAGYLVGSRGSVGSSFAAYLAGITEVNALAPHYICPKCKESIFFTNGEYNIGIDMPDKDCPHCGTKMIKDGFNIPFETFLGFEGDKVPDIDLNFSGEYQATAHKYVEELFGEGFVFKAGTIGTIAEKNAIGYAKKYYEQKGITPTRAELKRASKGLVGVKNTTGQHPGGIIVCPKTMDIHDFCPIQHPAEKKESGIITTHFDFHSIHDNLLKLDILGHDDPSTIRMLENLTGLDATKIPLDDPETMRIFSSTETIGVTPEQIKSKVGTFGIPEFGTSFTRQMLLDTLPTTFYELVLIAGLSHGTDVWLGNAQDLIKDGIATLSEVIGVRDDIMTYLMNKGVEPKTAFNIMEFVRKGRAAKEGMPEDFEKAMIENNVPEWYIDSCKKIKYMFPKAHAAAYVMMAFRVAYFKVHYPLEFYIAYYTVRADLFDGKIMAKGDEHLVSEMKKLLERQNEWSATEKSVFTICEIVHEMYQRGIEFVPVDLYESDAFKFQRVDGKIRLPINAFQGVGDAAAQNIVEARKDGEFMSIEDLKQRAKLTKVVIETLAENGCLKGMTETSQISLFDDI